MCDQKNSLKLCTCVHSTKLSSSWSVRRFKGCDWMEMEQGRCLYPKYTDIQLSTIQVISKELNNGNCFDFNFSPVEGDTLDIILVTDDKNTPYEFIYESNTWKNQNSISSHLNRNQTIEKGNLELNSYL